MISKDSQIRKIHNLKDPYLSNIYPYLSNNYPSNRFLDRRIRLWLRRMGRKMYIYRSFLDRKMIFRCRMISFEYSWHTDTDMTGWWKGDGLVKSTFGKRVWTDHAFSTNFDFEIKYSQKGKPYPENPVTGTHRNYGRKSPNTIQTSFKLPNPPLNTPERFRTRFYV